MLTSEDRIFEALLVFFGSMLPNGIYFMSAGKVGGRKFIVGTVLTIISVWGLIEITTNPRANLPRSALLVLSLVVVGIAVLGLDVYLTWHSRSQPVQPQESDPILPVSQEEKINISMAFYQLNSSWLQALTLYKVLTQAQISVSGLLNQFHGWGIIEAQETIIAPVVASPLIRSLSNDKISIRDDATRQELRKLFKANPLLLPLK